MSRLWKNKKPIYGKNRYYSLIKKLERENKITPEFKLILSSLPLEDIIACKLELVSEANNKKYYSLPLLGNVGTLVKASMVKFAISTTRTYHEAASVLGITNSELQKWLDILNIRSFFEEKTLDDV
jgi:type II secretory pathway component PulL